MSEYSDVPGSVVLCGPILTTILCINQTQNQPCGLYAVVKLQSACYKHQSVTWISLLHNMFRKSNRVLKEVGHTFVVMVCILPIFNS